MIECDKLRVKFDKFCVSHQVNKLKAIVGLDFLIMLTLSDLSY